MMMLIFSFSSQTGVDSGQLSYRVSYKIVEVGGQILDKPLEDWQIDAYAQKIEGPVRKLAHMTEFWPSRLPCRFMSTVSGDSHCF